MIAYLRPTHRFSRGTVMRASLALMLTVMMVLGSLSSRLPSAAAFPTADMSMDKQALQLAAQPAQPSGIELALAPATVQSSPTGSPVVGGTSVTIYAWECVYGTLTGQPMSYYQGEDQCEGVKLEVMFDVTDDNGTRQTTSAKDGSQIDGLVGEVTIGEALPEDYETPAVFCTPLNGQPGQELTGDGDSVTLPAEAGEDYQCSFFNIPSGVSATGTGDVLVYTYACAATPPPNSNYAWYHQNCTTGQNGASFVLDTPDGAIESTAGDFIDGAVSMRGLAPGNYPLAETDMMPDHEISAVFCAEIGKTEIAGPAQMLPQQLDGNTITASVTADMLYYCQWYHVPTTSGDGARPASKGLGELAGPADQEDIRVLAGRLGS